MAKKHFGVRSHLFHLGMFVSLVQSSTHVRRVRVGIFWSIVTLLFCIGTIEVKESIGMWGIFVRDLTNAKVLWFLLLMNVWYGGRFFLSAGKIIWQANPCVWWPGLRAYKRKCEIESNRNFWEHLEEMAANVAATEKDISTPLERILGFEKTNEALFYNARHPAFGVLENFFGLMLLPMLLCGASFFAIVWELGSYYISKLFS
ncbi:MAG: hypothetical protein MPL62_12860 [Alphaproteobacteria bacterium]|nr:hypothetical protein [Alphaproteobacteria bacterium]